MNEVLITSLLLVVALVSHYIGIYRGWFKGFAACKKIDDEHLTKLAKIWNETAHKVNTYIKSLEQKAGVGLSEPLELVPLKEKQDESKVNTNKVTEKDSA